MKKIFKIGYPATAYIEVEAENQDEAEEKAFEIKQNNLLNSPNFEGELGGIECQVWLDEHQDSFIADEWDACAPEGANADFIRIDREFENKDNER